MASSKPVDIDASSTASALCEKVLHRAKEANLETALAENASEIAQLAETDKGFKLLSEQTEAWCAADATLELPPQPAAGATASFAPREFPKQHLRIPDKPVPGVVEGDETPVKVYNNEEFENWGGTVRGVYPRYTFVPVSRVGICNIVKFARREGLRVRVSGARHSWSSVYGSDGEVLISIMELGAAEPLPGRLPDLNPLSNELEHIELVSVADDGATAHVKVGAAATNEHFRQWALSADGGDWKWMIPATPILVEITTGGSAQLICHGSGVDHKTVSDDVVAMEIVNPRGEIQNITDRMQLRAAAGALGLAGVLLSQTFRVSKLRLANMKPRKVATALAVPPVSHEDVPETDDFSIKQFSDAEVEAARQVFLKDANRFYSEWFWFPFQKDCWVHCWDTSAMSPGGERPLYPNERQIHWQRAQLGIGELFQKTLLRLLPGKTQAKLLATTSMAVLPSGEEITASVCDAIHFRRGVHRMEVRDFELEVPIPRTLDGTLDFSIVQKAWWMAIREVYREEAEGRAPMRVVLEMRVMGGSDITLACQRGNAATCAIEVLTNPATGESEWQRFIQNLMDNWATLKDPVTGRPLNVRPHWAKEWPGQIRGKETSQYLKETYKTASQEFKAQMAAIAKDGGYALKDTFAAFGNDVLLEILGGPEAKKRFSNCCMM